MILPTISQKPKIDYSGYELLLKKISSIQLENIADLKIVEQYTELVQSRFISESYVGKIKKLLLETGEEV